MDIKTAPVIAARWTAWQKILFRLLFCFLSLELMTDNFWAVWFGEAVMTIYRTAEKLFVPPTLWLNNHVFHFHYNPYPGYNYSYTLYAIRDISYLSLAVFACLIWTLVDKKRPSYNQLRYWFSQCLIIALACMLFSYGSIKVLPVQMPPPSLALLYTPLGELTPFQIIWTTFGYGAPYQIFSGLTEALAAGLILFRRTRVLGLLLAIVVILNVIMVNYTYIVGVQVTSCYLLLITLFLLAPYCGPLMQFFFTRKTALLHQKEFTPLRNKRTRLLRVAAFLFVGASFVLNIQAAYRRYANREALDQSRKYSLVKSFAVNNNTLPFIQNDTACWRAWSEYVRDGKRMVTISTMRTGADLSFTMEEDSANQQIILHPLGQPDTTAIAFTYKNNSETLWSLDGIMNQKHVHAELQRFHPDTTMTLLKSKRTVFPLDAE